MKKLITIKTIVPTVIFIAWIHIIHSQSFTYINSVPNEDKFLEPDIMKGYLINNNQIILLHTASFFVQKVVNASYYDKESLAFLKSSNFFPSPYLNNKKFKVWQIGPIIKLKSGNYEVHFKVYLGKNKLIKYYFQRLDDDLKFVGDPVNYYDESFADATTTYKYSYTGGIVNYYHEGIHLIISEYGKLAIFANGELILYENGVQKQSNSGDFIPKGDIFCGEGFLTESKLYQLLKSTDKSYELAIYDFTNEKSTVIPLNIDSAKQVYIKYAENEDKIYISIVPREENIKVSKIYMLTVDKKSNELTESKSNLPSTIFEKFGNFTTRVTYQIANHQIYIDNDAVYVTAEPYFKYDYNQYSDYYKNNYDNNTSFNIKNGSADSESSLLVSHVHQAIIAKYSLTGEEQWVELLKKDVRGQHLFTNSTISIVDSDENNFYFYYYGIPENEHQELFENFKVTDIAYHTKNSDIKIYIARISKANGTIHLSPVMDHPIEGSALMTNTAIVDNHEIYVYASKVNVSNSADILVKITPIY